MYLKNRRPAAASRENSQPCKHVFFGSHYSRLLFLDIIRGFALINMIFYHLLYDLVYIFGQQISWFSIRQCFVWQQMICMTFIFVSGISFKLSKNPLKNGFKLLICALILNLVTFFVIPDEFIVFGILHFLMAAIFLTILLKPLLERVPVYIGLPIAVFLFILIKNLPAGYLSFFSAWKYQLPPELYQSPLLFFAGLPQAGFKSADYFPVFPWWFLYLAGFYSMSYYQKFSSFLQEKYSIVDKMPYKFFDATLGLMGRYSLIVYMFHQPIIYGLLILVYFFG